MLFAVFLESRVDFILMPRLNLHPGGLLLLLNRLCYLTGGIWQALEEMLASLSLGEIDQLGGVLGGEIFLYTSSRAVG